MVGFHPQHSDLIGMRMRPGQQDLLKAPSDYTMQQSLRTTALVYVFL